MRVTYQILAPSGSGAKAFNSSDRNSRKPRHRTGSHARGFFSNRLVIRIGSFTGAAGYEYDDRNN